MKYTEYKFDPKYIQKEKARFLKRLKKNTEETDLVQFGSRVIADNLVKNPRRYRDFGPYWWAVKEVLIKQNLALGNTMDPEVRDEYKGKDDTETLVMGQIFSDDYKRTSFIGANRFQLAPEIEYTLYDPDYENPFSSFDGEGFF